MDNLNRRLFKEFLIRNLKLGARGFEDYIYDFDAYVREAECALQTGRNYELSGYESKNGKVQVFNFV